MFVEVTVLSIILSCQPRRCSTVRKDELLIFDSMNALPLTESKPVFPVILPETSVSGSLEAALAKDLASLSNVRHVLTERADGNLLVWIAIDDAESYEARSQVYEKELGLMDGFPEVNFDFNLIPAMNRKAGELATGAQVVYTRP